jgi:DNA-directed RNA polymerase I and III subunit RPAC1
MHAVLGIGQDHAKFSPVGSFFHFNCSQADHLATASYRLLPTIDIVAPILNDDAEKFVNCFPKGVADLETDKRGRKSAKIVNPRLDTVSREVLRHDEFKDKVKLGRVRDHFICISLRFGWLILRLVSIESTGILPPDDLFLKAVSLLRKKCNMLKSQLDATRHTL